MPAKGHRRQRIVLPARVLVDARARDPQQRGNLVRGEEGFGEHDGRVGRSEDLVAPVPVDAEIGRPLLPFSWRCPETFRWRSDMT